MKTQNCPKCGQELPVNARLCSSCGIEIKSRKLRNEMSNKKTNSSWLLIIGGVVLLVVGVLSVVPKLSANNSLSDMEDQPSESGLPYPEVDRAKADEVKFAFDQGNGLIVDVRSTAEYEEEHIPGAISIPLTEMEGRFQKLPLDQMIYLYCT